MISIWTWAKAAGKYVKHWFASPSLPSVEAEKEDESYWMPHWGPRPDPTLDPERN